MRILAIGLVSAALFGCVSSPPAEADVVSYARGLRVSAIDGSLPTNVALAEWIAARAQAGLVSWESIP